MSKPGQLSGFYNFIKKGDYETVQHQIPIEKFYEELENDGDLARVTVVGLEEAYDDEAFIADLSKAIDRNGDKLATAKPTPMIQFAVEADIHRGDRAPELFYEGELHSLFKLFGGPFKSRKNNWYTAPF
ncbi:hypothetical protein C5C07_19165 [Haloferax sp. Atlit-4N]|uniref:hypothetical protein n=1 Tax=Haloferax sp. Atlit-4N TaxID=2077206 RepID=UPI000E26762B|nr:hypothetical protein [Haloferax sp. Atlit-4N]RDZ50444.1 hypothetical protein C5C07_19165 [Haloferax sp. Atlit-4N]